MTKLHVIVAASLVLAAGGTARADGRFQVDPTRVDLATDAPTAALIVSNEGTSPLRLQMTVFRWHDGVDGGMQLDPAPDVIVRPALVEIPAGEKRPIRIGLVAPIGDVEGAYRVFVEELPDRRPAVGGHIEVLTRIGVPIFVAPHRPAADLHATVTLAGSAAAVTVTGAGSVHVKLASVRVVATTAEGVAKWQHDGAGWYVLAGATRRFAVDVSHDTCVAGDHLVAEMTDEDGKTWTSTPMTCGG